MPLLLIAMPRYLGTEYVPYMYIIYISANSS